MKRLVNLENGHVLTSGEKALLVMLVAGMFGYWAGSTFRPRACRTDCRSP